MSMSRSNAIVFCCGVEAAAGGLLRNRQPMKAFGAQHCGNVADWISMEIEEKSFRSRISELTARSRGGLTNPVGVPSGTRVWRLWE